MFILCLQQEAKLKRLTYNSANDYPYDFTVDDKKVLFGTNRNDIYTSARFPIRGLFQKLYEVPVTGGRSVMYFSAGSEFAHFNSKGDKVIFQDRKGYEDAYRKHHTSAVTRDFGCMILKKMIIRRYLLLKVRTVNLFGARMIIRFITSVKETDHRIFSKAP